jgi:hypothetical protein
MGASFKRALFLGGGAFFGLLSIKIVLKIVEKSIDA